MMGKRIAVLMGGWSAEREVSLVSGEACADALERRGHEVVRIDLRRDLSALLNVIEEKPDVVFNALHGRWGEDGNIQGVLNILGIPYTHSGLLASAVAMDKAMAKKLFEAEGIPCPPGKVVSMEQLRAGRVIEPPYVIKPVDEGSSVGVHIVEAGANELPLDDLAPGFRYGRPRAGGDRIAAAPGILRLHGQIHRWKDDSSVPRANFRRGRP
jgi:D-alanine-D-alanine ligase